MEDRKQAGVSSRLATTHWEHIGGRLSRKGHVGRARTSPKAGRKAVGKQESAAVMVAAVRERTDGGYGEKEGGGLTAARASIAR